MTPAPPIRIAIVDRYDVVVEGLVRMFEPFADRVVVVEPSADVPGGRAVDIALVHEVARAREVDQLLEEANASRLVVCGWSLEPELLKTWSRFGVAGFLDLRLGAADLVEVLEEIASRERAVAEPDPDGHAGDWPGREHGLTPRESEVIALITLGLSNHEVACRAYLSLNTVKSYIRSSYRKMGVTSRSRAVLWGLDHGFRQVHPSGRPTDSAW